MIRSSLERALEGTPILYVAGITESGKGEEGDIPEQKLAAAQKRSDLSW